MALKTLFLTAGHSGWENVDKYDNITSVHLPAAFCMLGTPEVQLEPDKHNRPFYLVLNIELELIILTISQVNSPRIICVSQQ